MDTHGGMMEVVMRAGTSKGLVPLPRRGVVERVVMHSNDSGRERCIVVVDKVPNRTEMITQLFGKGK